MQRKLACLAGALALALALLPAESRAASPAAATPTFTTTGAFFALSVADVDASAKWYAEKLGLKVVLQPPRSGGSAVVALEGGGLMVELIQLDEAVPLSKAAPQAKGSLFVHGIAKVGVIVDDFDKALSALRSRGVEIAMGPYPARDGQRANVIVRDNAGNLIQLFGR